MTQDGGLFGGNCGYVGKIRFHHSKAVAVKVVLDAGSQVRFAPVNLVIFAGLGALDIMGAADPVIIGSRVVIAVQIPFQAAQNVQLAGIALFQLGYLGAVQLGACIGHAILNVVRGVAVAREAQRFQPGFPGAQGKLLRGVFSVTQLGVNMNRTEQILFSHYCILSCFTLWSITWRFSSSLVMSSTEMPSSIIKTITW